MPLWGQLKEEEGDMTREDGDMTIETPYLRSTYDDALDERKRSQLFYQMYKEMEKEVEALTNLLAQRGFRISRHFKREQELLEECKQLRQVNVQLRQDCEKLKQESKQLKQDCLELGTERR